MIIEFIFSRATTSIVALAAFLVGFGHFVEASFAREAKAHNHQSAAKESASVSDFLNRAQEKFLAGKRAEALQLVSSAIRRQQKKGKVSSELWSALDTISSTFLANSTQQVFESGLAAFSVDPSLARAKFNEALALEPNHLQIRLELARLDLREDCRSGLRSFDALESDFPFSELVELGQRQAQECLGLANALKPLLSGKKSTAATIENSIREPRRIENKPYWLEVEFEEQLRLGQARKAKESASELQRRYPAYPGGWLAMYRILSAGMPEGRVAGEKYIATCKGLTNRSIRNYRLQPRVCARISEVEAELSKLQQDVSIEKAPSNTHKPSKSGNSNLSEQTE